MKSDLGQGIPSASALEHSHGEEPCDACGASMNRPAASGCRFSPQRANGAADQ